MTYRARVIAAAAASQASGPVAVPFTILEGQTGIVLGIDWSGYAPGIYRITVNVDGQAPVVYDVTILATVTINTSLSANSPEGG